MKRQSKKRKELMDEVGPLREAFKREFAACMACPLTNQTPSRNPILDVHEIARGAHRDEALRDRRAWLLVCRECHEEMGDAHLWPIARQYALKARCDPSHYDRVFLNELRGRAPEAITADEVAVFDGTLIGKAVVARRSEEPAKPRSDPFDSQLPDGATVGFLLSFGEKWLKIGREIEDVDTSTLSGILSYVKATGQYNGKQLLAVRNISRFIASQRKRAK